MFLRKENSKSELLENILEYNEIINYNILFMSLIFFSSIFIGNKIFKFAKYFENYIRISHSFLSILLFNFNIIHIPEISIGFFLADIIKLNIGLPFVFHHIISIIGLVIIKLNIDNIIKFNFGIKIFYILEFSNIFLYINYFVIKTVNQNLIRFLFLFTQFIWYSYFRIYRFTKLLIDNLELVFEMDYYKKSIITILYIMGFLWSYKLLIQIKISLKNLYYSKNKKMV